VEKQILQANGAFDQLMHKILQLPIVTDPHVMSAKDKLTQYNKQIVAAFAYSDFIKKVALQYPHAFVEVLLRIDVAHTTIKQQGQLLDISHYVDSWKSLKLRLTALAQTNAPDQAIEVKASALIRQFRNIQMLEIAYYDLHQLQSIETSLLAVSKLANTIIIDAYDFLYFAMCKRYGEPENKQPLLIMGMGKLGGQELNFSSDIDLIFTYPQQGETQNSDTRKNSLEHQVFFTRLAQKLITILDQVTQDGFAYRVDMRLRPMGESGPLVLPFSAIESYYQEQGRQWERFAMQKMRIINQTPYNQALYAIIKPFVYRKYIDFTTIESIREMKELITKEVRRRQIKHNIKLGQGGIREVEFFVQSLQLIHAGRQTSCQRTSILESMYALQNANLTADIDMKQLQEDYLYLRKVEHYLQIFNDEQTQTLPFANPKMSEELALINQVRLCHLFAQDQTDISDFHHCDCSIDFAQLSDKIDTCMSRINSVFNTVVADANDKTSNNSTHDKLNTHITNTLPSKIIDALDDIWQLSMQKSEAIEALEENLSQDTAEIFVDHLLKFKKKTERAGVSPRALKSINKLMPLLLSELLVVEGEFDDDVFIDQIQGIFDILQTICGRVTYIDLLLENPDVRHRLVYLCKKSLWVSQQIAQYPILLDELLHPQYLDKNELSLAQYKLQIADSLRQSMLRIDSQDEEVVMDRLREFKHITQLRIAAGDISGTLAINQVSDKLTLLAEVIMQQVIDLAWQQMVKLYGQPTLASNKDAFRPQTAPLDEKNSDIGIEDSKQLALIAYGKFGGIELSYGSDLDVVFLHNADLSLSTDNTGSRKQLSNQEFYIKLVQRICHICTTKTYSGILYDIDLRLRPSGNSGLLVSHVDTFFDYQQTNAWTWEHQALVRSRVVVARSDLKEYFNDIRHKVLCMLRDTSELKQEVITMREKMRSHLESKQVNYVDIKQTSGGIVDVEFLVQYLILANAHKNANITQYSDNLRLLDALQAIKSISNEQRESLTNAYLTLRHATHRIQLANRKLARGGDKLSKKLANALQDVKYIYDQIFA
jgi:glutamate-ammonia-ligase adenylyltransferase